MHILFLIFFKHEFFLFSVIFRFAIPYYYLLCNFYLSSFSFYICLLFSLQHYIKFCFPYQIFFKHQNSLLHISCLLDFVMQMYIKKGGVGVGDRLIVKHIGVKNLDYLGIEDSSGINNFKSLWRLISETYSTLPLFATFYH